MIITLLSDFGYQDNFVGVAKGILLAGMPDAKLVDISHGVMPFNILQCSYLLKSAYRNFPPHTIHLALFHVMHRNPARLLLTEVHNQYVLSADNGLLPLCFQNELESVYVAAADCRTYESWLHHAAAFIGRFSSDLRLDGLEQVSDYVTLPMRLEPFAIPNGLECQILHIDHFGNVVINLTQGEFEAHRQERAFRIHFSRIHQVGRIHKDYSEVPPGEIFCLFNSGGFLELGIRDGSAAQLFGYSLMLHHQLLYQKIKIQFL